MIKKIKPRKCKECGDSYTPKYSTIQSTCYNPQCIISFNRKKELKKWKKKKAVLKKEIKTDYQKLMQNNINKLARMIDVKFGYVDCICCDRRIDKRVAGAHFHSVGGNNTIRYNLHNIHSSTFQCNNYSNTHITGYKEGLKKRYGEVYQGYVLELPEVYKFMKFGKNEIREKLSIVRQIIREFDSLEFEGSKEAREILNKRIGIY